MTLRIQESHLDQLRQHAEASYPHEACGILLGDFGPAGQRSVQRIVQCRNACPEAPERRYGIAPEELLRIQREAREGGQAILGFYHSHPQGPAHWSPSDLEEAHWTGCSYVIVALYAGRATAIRSYLLVGTPAGKYFDDEALEPY